MSVEGVDPFDGDPRYQLAALLEAGREGVVDGVSFDLRHPSIPPELWHAPDGAYDIDLWFPSERIETDADNEFARESDAPWVQAEVGDGISIAALRRFDRHEGPLADVHDTEEWWAHLRLIRRATGERIDLGGVMCFVPRDALGPHSPHIPPGDEDYADYVEQHGITFEKIGRRIERLAASTKRREPAMWATINGVRARVSEAVLPLLPPDTEVEHGWAYEGPFGPAREWLTMADNAHCFAIEEVGALEEATSVDLVALLDTVAAAAYSLARAESELRVAPLAKNTLKVIEGGALGGKRRAENRRKWVAAHWEPHAIELGKALREKAPSLGQTNLAAEILFAWSSDVSPPGHDWMLNFVRAAERQGLIPRRRRSGGPKGVGPTA